MSNHFIKEIEIESFKCFKNFKAEGFGRVNLIGGKNNVGKTALMEAMYLNLSGKNINTFSTSIIKISVWRNFSFLSEKLSHLFSDITKILESLEEIISIKDLNKLFLKKIDYFNITTNLNKTIFKNKNNELFFQTKYFKVKENISNFKYIEEFTPNLYYNNSTLFSTNDILSIRYRELQKEDREEIFNQILNKFDNSIEKFKIIDNEAFLKVKNRNKLIEIAEFGDGLRRYCEIILDILTCKNGHIFIDEIDNGIHYSIFDKLWEIILTISKEQNVQVFATTHSKEMIESYARVAKRLEDEKKLENEDITFIGLHKLKDGSIFSAVRNLNLIESSLEDERELR